MANEPLFIITTPSFVMDQASLTDGRVRSLEAFESKLDSNNLTLWKTFKGEWKTFFASVKESWLKRSMGATWKTLQTYIKTVENWEQLYKDKGAAPAAIVAVPSESEMRFPWNKLLLAGGIAVVLIYFLKSPSSPTPQVIKVETQSPDLG